MKQQGLWIERMWRTSLLLVMLSQVFFLAIRTPVGARVLPAFLVKIRFMRRQQVGFLMKTINPDNRGVVRSLISEIHHMVPNDSKLEIVWSGTPLMIDVAELNYDLYPRPLTQRAGYPGDHSDGGCRIDWGSEMDVTLTCPGSVWKYHTSDVDQR